MKRQRKTEEGKGEGKERKTDKTRNHSWCVSKFEKVNFQDKNLILKHTLKGKFSAKCGRLLQHSAVCMTCSHVTLDT